MERIEPADPVDKKTLFTDFPGHYLFRINVHKNKTGKNKKEINEVPAAEVKPFELAVEGKLRRFSFKELHVEMPVMPENGNTYCRDSPE